MLDEQFRERVQRLARSDERELGEAARERILQTVRQRGSAEARKGRRRHLGTLVLAGAGAAAAAGWLLGVQLPEAPVTATTPVVATAVDERPCSKQHFVADATFAKSDRSQRLVLDGRASFFAPLEASVSVRSLEACRTVVSLEEGTVAVVARDLQGGELVVESGEHSVSVHGTIFSVARRADVLTVDVVEGVVSVADGKGARRVVGGQSLQVSPVGVALSALPQDRANATRRMVGEAEIVSIDALQPAPGASGGEPSHGPPPTVTHAERTARGEPRVMNAEPGPSPDVSGEPLAETTSAAELLSRAEAERRGGRYGEARRLYRQAGAASEPTAEAAWLALARMELAGGNVPGARSALDEHARRFGGRSALGPEAAWMNVRVHRAAGATERARQVASQLVQRWPKAPQAAAARRFLSGG